MSLPKPVTVFSDRQIEELERRYDRAERESKVTLREALGLALAVGKLLAFGGGNLRLPDGTVFKLARACDACKNAVRMFTRAGHESRFCPRCADQLATERWQEI